MTNEADHLSAEDITIGVHALEGQLTVPRDPIGTVIFAHGSGSSRFSPRNRFVATELSKKGFAALLFDLLTAEEAEDRRNVFDIALLAGRVVEASDAAVVSRGGRPDLAASDLAQVQAPTILIVGGADFEVIDLNRAATDQMNCVRSMRIVEGATHLFEETGALEQVVEAAAVWFRSHMEKSDAQQS
jgi:putative phosphoribosyl transferase